MPKWIHILTITCALTPLAGAQPHIGAVVSAADFHPGVALSGIGTIFGSGLSDTGQYSALPYPTSLGPTEVFLCLSGKLVQINTAACEPLRLIFVSQTQINFQMLDMLPLKPGFASSPLSAVVRVGGILDDGATSGKSAGIQIGSGGFLSAPRIFSMGYDCLTDNRFKDANQNCGLTSTKADTLQADRGAITDQQGRLITSAIRARLGDYYTIWMTGLGKLPADGKPPSNFRIGFTNVPVFGYSGDTNLFSAVPTYVGLSPQYPGLYQVNFQLPKSIAGGHPSGYPPLFPCSDYDWEISVDLTWGTARANPIQIPVTIKRGDVPCAQ